jgi:serine protein kinase
MNSSELFETMINSSKREFNDKNYILSFPEFLDVFSKSPKLLSRHSAEYIRDMIEHFGIVHESTVHGQKKLRFKLFERNRGRNRPPIVGQEDAHEQIYRILEQFVRQGRIDKLILLHGPNGSSKSSTAEALATALEEYSRTDEGAVYKFNWIFPNDKVGYEGLGNPDLGKHIGFGELQNTKNGKASYAHLNDDDILCKVVSELRENPLFLLPKKYRMDLFLSSLNTNKSLPEETNQVPVHIEEGALSSRNKLIFDALMLAYKGDLEKVFKHVQVERFFFSGRYRTGIATVEPQMTVDAQDRQLTMDRNLQNIPPVLQNMRLFEPSGDLIDANRGLIEFADLLKRPLEAFKYLLTTIEKMNINLASGIADLDLVMIASSNEKHLDAFKASPDWASFKGRFELIRVPYLLSSKQESVIYQDDVRTIEKTKSIAPHTLDLVSKFAVLTRLRQPDPEYFDYSLRNLISRISPFDKMALYDDEEPGDHFTDTEKAALRKQIAELKKESQLSVAYEGRFGASPREIKTMLYFAAQSADSDQLSAVDVIEEIEKLIRDRTVYDYLQFEPRGQYHDFREFLQFIKSTYAKSFHRDFLKALKLFNESQYLSAFQKYLRNAVAFIKNERVENDITGKLEPANESVLTEIEDLIGAGNVANKKELREKMVGRIASWKVENADTQLNISKIFAPELASIAKKIYESKEEYIRMVRDGMLMHDSEDYNKLPSETRKSCDEVFESLQKESGYSRNSSWKSLVFLRTHS